jgi:N-acetylneuraminic acid mutarotase
MALLLLPLQIMTQNVTTENLNKPKALIYHCLLYHDKTGNFLVFAGIPKHTGIGDLHDIWKYIPKAEQWEEVRTSKAVPADGKIGINSISYDQESDQFITIDENGRTWSYNFEKNQLKEMKSYPSPPGIFGQGMVYDKESDRIIMFGGAAFGPKRDVDTIFSDTWAYDYNTNIWTKMNPKISPSARIYFAMTYDDSNDKVILWGGRKIDPITDNRIWIYDFNTDTWESKENIGGPEKPLAYPSMVFRKKTKDIILFGGAKIESKFKGTLTNETWSYNLKQNKWELLLPKISPPPIALHSMAYNPKKNTIFLFGGELETMYSNKLSRDSWTFDSKQNTWIKK